VDPDDVAAGNVGDEEDTYVWGTTVRVGQDSNRFRRFIEHFELASRPGVAHYDERLRECLERESHQLDLDCQHLHSYDPELYGKLVSYPQEMIPLFDQVANEHFAERVLPPGEETFARIQVRTFNLKETRAMRLLNPSDIDKMVAVRGMVTRCSGVIPDLKMAFFKCLVCGNAPEMTYVDRGRVNEPPMKCPGCDALGTATLIHNRCIFANKQQVKMQETPDAIPEGETPNTVSMCVFDSLVDEAKPGDRVEITGVYRAVPIRVAPTQRVLKAVYKTYLDVIHIRKDTTARIKNTAAREDEEDRARHERDGVAVAGDRWNDDDANNLGGLRPDSSKGPNAEAEFTPERIAALEEIGKREDVYERLVSSLAPSIWEMEEVKKGLLCQLFGATHKTLTGSAAGSRVRGDINVILVGDPGVSKSQLLTYVNKVAPRGIYTSGRGSSAVGLTAYVTRDPETKDFVLESGALVLSDRGICCIDEFDKMSEGARSTLHEVMEQQTVSIAKAGIIAVLNARTSVLASANPIGSRYNPNMSVVENIDLPPTLLSRFDLIFLVLDKPNVETDKRLAAHLISLHFEKPPEKVTGALDAATLTEYISYARSKYHPVLSDEAAEHLVEGYVDMRRLGVGGGRKVITATPRQLESSIRLAESLARMRLSNVVEKRDSTEALRLMRAAMQQAAWDPKTGQIDMDKILTGHSASDRRQRSAIAEGVAEILAESGRGAARLAELVVKLKERNGAFDVSVQEVRDAAQALVEQERAIIKGDLVTMM
jgi:DNA replication licensing factor MCM4